MKSEDFKVFKVQGICGYTGPCYYRYDRACYYRPGCRDLIKERDSE